MNTPAVRHVSKYQHLWPLFVLLAFEIMAFVYFGVISGNGPPVPVTPLSAMVAVLILLSGLLPALIRPGLETMLTGCLATVMASILVVPMSMGELPDRMMQNQVIRNASGYLVLRLVNGVCLGPLALHLAARFPRRGRVSDRQLVGVYLVSLLLLFIFLLTTSVFLRILSMAMLTVWMLVLLLSAARLLLLASRDTHPDHQRQAQQARLLFFAIVLAETPALLRPLGLFLGVEIFPYDLFLLAQIIVPAAIAYAVLRHDLFGIDSALRRGIAYAVLSALLLVVYLAVSAGLAALLANTWPELRFLAAGIGLFIAAIAFEPARKRLQFLIDRALYPDRIHFQREIQLAREALKRVVSRGEVIQLLTEEFPTRLGAAWASLTLAPEPDVPGVTDGPPAWNGQLMVAGRSLGRYWLGPRRAGPSFEREEQAQLEGLVSQAALALAYADTIEELSNLNRELEQRVEFRTAQVVEQQRSLAALEERQHLARELHDSVTQSLFSINLSARALRSLVRSEPETAVEGLSELEQAARESLKEMRALLAQLRAPNNQSQTPIDAIESGDSSPENQGMCDLSQLLGEHCDRLENGFFNNQGHDHFVITRNITEGIIVPEQTAHQVMQIAREALHNAQKHSGAHQVECCLSRVNQHLQLAIQDDGVGFQLEQAGSQGFGLRGMRERVDELGGSFRIDSRLGGGTRIKVDIPIDEVTG